MLPEDDHPCYTLQVENWKNPLWEMWPAQAKTPKNTDTKGTHTT